MNPKVNNLVCLSMVAMLGLSSISVNAQQTSNNSANDDLTPGDALSNSTVVFPYKDARKWYAGLQAGITTFHGDMGKIKPGFQGGLLVGYDFGTVFGVRGQFAAGTLAGENTQGGSFDATIFDGALQGVFTLGNQSFFRKARRLNMYIPVGVGMTSFNSTSAGVDPTVVFSPYNSNVKDITFHANLGLGFRFALTKALDLGIETNYRYTFTDYLDAYYPLLRFPNRAKDTYFLHSINLVYNFGKKNAMNRHWINPITVMYEDLADNKKKVQMLSKDADNDGVADYFDKDPSTPDSVAVYGNGKAVDTDGDGVADYKDKEPFSDKGAAVDADGKMADDDKDGVPNVRDISPATDSSLVVNFQGVPFMTKDLARKLAAKKGSSGMGDIPVLPVVFFDINSSVVKSSSYSALYEVAEIMRTNPDLKIKVIGNTDETAGDRYNQALGQRRADAVKTKLTSWFGIDAARIVTESQGEKAPLVKGRGYDANTANRRVQFFIYEGK